jgi:hypothetical protein
METKENKIEDLNVKGHKVEFSTKTGEVISIDKNITTSANGKRQFVKQDVWIKTKDGSEVLAKITADDSLPLREGHEITVVELQNPRMKEAFPAYVVNHTTKAAKYLLESAMLFNLGFKTGLDKVYYMALIALSILGFLIYGLAGVAMAAFWSTVGLFAAFIFLVLPIHAHSSTKIENHIKEQLQAIGRGV